MRIGILGKGGSGKTTISSILSVYFANLNKNREILVIDADLNSHLDDSLKIKFFKKGIGDRFEELRDLLHNGRKDIAKDKMIGTTCPNNKSKFIRLNKDDPIINDFCIKKDNIFFTKVGTYSKEDIGTTCYHSKLNSLELFLHHYLDFKEDISIIDSTAGIDILGSSLIISYDFLCFVVEPSLKSIQICKDFLLKFKSLNLSQTKICVIGNKITENSDIEFIKKQLENEISIFFFIPIHPFFRKIEKGEDLDLKLIVDDLKINLNEISEYFNLNYLKNFSIYKDNLNNFHNKISLAWYNDFFGEDISNLDIKKFSYEFFLLKK